MRLLVTLVSLAVFAPAFASEGPPAEGIRESAPEQRAKAGPEAGQPLDCPAILRGHEEHEGEPEVAEYIFHHVSDSRKVVLENPFAKSELTLDFKKLECKAFGWNGILHVGGRTVDLTPTKHTFWLWVAAVVLIAIFWLGAPRKGQLLPRGLGTMLETMVLFVRDDIARTNISDRKVADRFTPYLLTCFFFIFVMNLMGLVPYAASATSNIAVTLGLALCTLLLTELTNLRSAGLAGYLKHLTGGVHPLLWPILIPIEIIGKFTKPFALTIRLFANMIAGHIVIFFLIGLIFILKSVWLALVAVPFAFGIYLLELLVALLQAFVFTLLSALFIGLAAEAGHHEGAHDESGAHDEKAGHAVHH